MELTFFGAAGEVTGSCAKVRYDGGLFLVDCGMFQGGRDAGRKNLGALDFNLREIDFVLRCNDRTAGVVHTVLIKEQPDNLMTTGKHGFGKAQRAARGRGVWRAVHGYGKFHEDPA